MLNHTAGFCGTVHRYQFFGAAEIIFGLRDGSRYNTDMIRGFFSITARLKVLRLCFRLFAAPEDG